jgi:hypothetical protein
MQEMSMPPDAGYVVDWQLNEDAPVVIDLATAETELVLPDDSHVRNASSRR